MSNTSATDPPDVVRRSLLVAAATMAAPTAFGQSAKYSRPHMTNLTPTQLAIGPIAGSVAVGDMTRLNGALHKGLDAGLAVVAT